MDVSLGDLATITTILAVVGGGIFGYLRWRGGVILMSPSVLDALNKLQNQNVKLGDELDEEREKRRNLEAVMEARFATLKKSADETHSQLVALKRQYTKTKKELDETKLLLSLYKDTIDLLLAWTNEYTPALKAAGIEPPDVDESQFRG
jgi:hypothetical protein